MAEEEYGKNETVKIIKSITSENTTKLRKKIEPVIRKVNGMQRGKIG